MRSAISGPPRESMICSPSIDPSSAAGTRAKPVISIKSPPLTATAAERIQTGAVGPFLGSTRFPEAEAQSVARLPGVESAIPVVYGNTIMQDRRSPENLNVYGVPEQAMPRIAAGRPPSNPGEAVVSNTLGRSIGDDVEVGPQRLKIVVPATLLIIFALLYATFRRWDEAALIMATLPFALTGGVWLLYLLGYNQSVATGVGFIALAGVAAEFGVVMLIYLKHALAEHPPEDVEAAVREGALLRVRPKAMTVAVILAGLFPILIGTGTGSEVMSRIAAPMVGGMISAPLLSMFVVPAVYLLMRRRRGKNSAERTSTDKATSV